MRNNPRNGDMYLGERNAVNSYVRASSKNDHPLWITLLRSRDILHWRDPQKTKYTATQSIARGTEQGHAFVRGQSIDCPLACLLDFLDASAQRCASKNPTPSRKIPARFNPLAPRIHIRRDIFVIIQGVS